MQNYSTREFHMCFYRWTNRHSLFISDTGRIPDAKCFHRRMTCFQRHPGLCQTTDATIYEDALLVGRNMERYFNDDCLNLFFKIAVPGGDFEIVYCAFKTERRPHSQVTHVFIGTRLYDGPQPELGVETYTPPALGLTRVMSLE